MSTDTKTLSERLRDPESTAFTAAVRHAAADALDAKDALLAEARDRIAEIIGIQDFTAQHPAAARLSEREIAAYRSLLSKLTEATKP